MQHYSRMVQSEGPTWIGCRYKCPIIWYPPDGYNVEYELSKRGESEAFKVIQNKNGFRKYGEHSYLAYSLTLLHANHLFA